MFANSYNYITFVKILNIVAQETGFFRSLTEHI